MHVITRDQLYQAGILFVVSVIISFLAVIPFPIKPNIYIIASVLGALVIDHFFLYGSFLAVWLWWLKYTPYPTPELYAIGSIGLAAFIFRRVFVREARPVFMVVLVGIAQAVFWLLFSREGLWSWLFVIELFYNILVTLVVYGIWVWAKKIFT